MITTKAVMNSLLDHGADVESLAVLSPFRAGFRACLTARGDELFELADAVLSQATSRGRGTIPGRRGAHAVGGQQDILAGRGSPAIATTGWSPIGDLPLSATSDPRSGRCVRSV